MSALKRETLAFTNPNNKARRAWSPRRTRRHVYRNRARSMLTVLGGLAEFERDLIRARTHRRSAFPLPSEGRARAVARGQRARAVWTNGRCGCAV
jgi:hypothetical protein